MASNKLLRRWCADVIGDVLSIGSGGDIDKQGQRYRDYFTKASSYTTSDIDRAMGCDLVLDARWMPEIRDCSYDAVFVSGVLEHVWEAQQAVSEIWRVLKPGGVLIVGVPFNQPIHRAPHDYHRWTEFGLSALLAKFQVEVIVPIGDLAYPKGYWARARK